MSDNQEQVEYWNGEAGDKWVRFQDRLDTQLEAFGTKAIDGAALGAGDTVVDIGCGCGATTLAAARAVGSGGRAIGIDVSGPMLELARERAKADGLDNCEFVQMDAQEGDLSAMAANAVISRFGVMFFADPVKAFANILTALAPGGRLSFACWQRVDQNPWIFVPTVAAASLLTIEAPPDPTAPGPFAFADPDRLRGILEDAGFAQVNLESFEPTFNVAGFGGLGDTADFLMDLGPVSRLLQEESEDKRTAVRQAIIDALAPFEKDGNVAMGSATWVATGVRG